MDDLDGFEDFWKVYPRHQGKIDAQKAYRQAIKMVSPATIVDAARKYNFECIGKDMQYIKLPAGWLRAGRWGDILSRTVDTPADTPTANGLVKIFAGTPQMDAWDAYWRKTKGINAPRYHRENCWWFDAPWPPGHEVAA